MPPNSPVGQEIGYRNELAAIEDPDQRKATYEEMVARSYERGKA